jgi:D-beta-D-heptose 7-phosphate kinase/D-beta-D-heptose 1-phosphate adenosyltransferase
VTRVHLANHAAGIVVGKPGAASVTRRELSSASTARARHAHEPKVAQGEQLARSSPWRAQGKRIVFTNGCFDILHVGTSTTCASRAARRRADRRRQRRRERAAPQGLRAAGQSARGPHGDAGRARDGRRARAVRRGHAARIVERVDPHVLVKGDDWRDKGVVGREWVEAHGGKVVLAPLVPGRSTSKILEKARGSPLR